MEKRGVGAQIDWIIGISMFLLAIGFILVFFKPGVNPVNSSNVLLDVLEDNFRSDIMWNISRVPIFIEPVKYCTEDSSSGVPVFSCQFDNGGKVVYFGGLPGDSHNPNMDSGIYGLIKNLKQENLEVYFVDNDDGPTEADSLNTDQENGKDPDITDWDVDTTPEDDENQIIVDVFADSRNSNDKIPLVTSEGKALKSFLDETYSPHRFYIKTKLKLPNEKTKNYLIYTGDIINLRGNALGPIILENEGQAITACIINRDLNPENNIVDRENKHCRAKYQIGVSEELEGVSLVKLELLKIKSLDDVKEEWGFPLNREFRIIISGESDLQSTPQKFNFDDYGFKGLIYPETASPPANVNVFSRRFSDFILNDEGELIPVIVTLQVW